MVALSLSEPIESFQGAALTFLEDDLDAALVGGVEDRLRPLGIRRVVDAERRQDKGPVNGTSVLGTTRRPLPAPGTAWTTSVSPEFLPEWSVGPEAWARPHGPNAPDRVSEWLRGGEEEDHVHVVGKRGLGLPIEVPELETIRERGALRPSPVREEVHGSPPASADEEGGRVDDDTTLLSGR